MKNDFLSTDKRFNMLSIEDLLEARDLYHIHLAHKANVVATAVGRYLIRKGDPWPQSRRAADQAERRASKAKHRAPRRLENSEVRPYSWPCIIVFVGEWADPSEFGPDARFDSQDMVPKALFLPDGRVVPVCVVLATRSEAPPSTSNAFVFPRDFVGGGYPVVAKVQGREHVASIGCLVSDGHKTYALTNRHVAGDAGEVVYTVLGTELTPIGTSSVRQLTRMPFEDVYEGWPGKNVYVNLDIGLIDIADLTDWTAQVYGIGTVGKIADLSMENISLRLIGCPVRAYGCASGLMQGTIQALFYRYKAVGGYEYVADFLVGGRDRQPLETRPGDSGTLWLMETGSEEDGLMPVAVQWGGHVFADQAGTSQLSFALATCLSTVCNMLDVDLIRDWNLGHVEYWGEMGHYSVGRLACDMVSSTKLRRFIRANADRIAFDYETLKDTDKYKKNAAHYTYVPLADVADDVWRNTRTGSADVNNDENNHFADMDQPGGPGPYHGKTLLELCRGKANVDAQVWRDFYASVGGNPGALPFRVWQMYKTMVDYLTDANGPDLVGFLSTAGCLAHYVGDACQPLHVSRLHHGYPNASSVGKKVHSVYETDMLDVYAAEFVPMLRQRLAGVAAEAKNLDGKGAAIEVIELMRRTVRAIPPERIVDAYNEESGPAARRDRLWEDFGAKTADRMIDGAKVLATLWESAWAAGGGGQIPNADLVEIDENEISTLYRKRSFCPSVGLDYIDDYL